MIIQNLNENINFKNNNPIYNIYLRIIKMLLTNISTKSSKIKPKSLLINTILKPQNYRPVKKIGPCEYPITNYNSNEPNEICNHLYLGGFENLSKININNLKIRCIFNLHTSPINIDIIDETKCINFPFQDDISINIMEYIKNIIPQMDQFIKEGKNILVMCQRGISRSATIVIAYLIYKKKISYQHALELVRSKRDIIEPNIGFALALEQNEDIIKNEILFIH